MAAALLESEVGVDPHPTLRSVAADLDTLVLAFAAYTEAPGIALAYDVIGTRPLGPNPLTRGIWTTLYDTCEETLRRSREPLAPAVHELLRAAGWLVGRNAFEAARALARARAIVASRRGAVW